MRTAEDHPGGICRPDCIQSIHLIQLSFDEIWAESAPFVVTTPSSPKVSFTWNAVPLSHFPSATSTTGQSTRQLEICPRIHEELWKNHNIYTTHEKPAQRPQDKPSSPQPWDWIQETGASVQRDIVRQGPGIRSLRTFSSRAWSLYLQREETSCWQRLEPQDPWNVPDLIFSLSPSGPCYPGSNNSLWAVQLSFLLKGIYWALAVTLSTNLEWEVGFWNVFLTKNTTLGREEDKPNLRYLPPGTRA